MTGNSLMVNYPNYTFVETRWNFVCTDWVFICIGPFLFLDNFVPKSPECRLHTVCMPRRGFPSLDAPSLRGFWAPGRRTRRRVGTLTRPATGSAPPRLATLTPPGSMSRPSGSEWRWRERVACLGSRRWWVVGGVLFLSKKKDRARRVSNSQKGPPAPAARNIKRSGSMGWFWRSGSSATWC